MTPDKHIVVIQRRCLPLWKISPWILLCWQMVPAQWKPQRKALHNSKYPSASLFVLSSSSYTSGEPSLRVEYLGAVFQLWNAGTGIMRLHRPSQAKVLYLHPAYSNVLRAEITIPPSTLMAVRHSSIERGGTIPALSSTSSTFPSKLHRKAVSPCAWAPKRRDTNGCRKRANRSTSFSTALTPAPP